MAFITYPLNNIDYTAEDAELFHCTRTSGIWAEGSFPISVTGADNNVTIGTGIAWINNEDFSGKVAALKAGEVHDLGIADSVYPRIDVIAIQFSTNANATSIVVKKGTPATSPVRPTLTRTGSIYELFLCEILRPAGATTVTAANVTDLRLDESVCGLMADSVTKVDTMAINEQIKGFINDFNEEAQKELDDFQSEIDRIKESGVTADDVPYDALTSGLEADTVQEAIDEITEKKITVSLSRDEEKTVTLTENTTYTVGVDVFVGETVTISGTGAGYSYTKTDGSFGSKSAGSETSIAAVIGSDWESITIASGLTVTLPDVSASLGGTDDVLLGVNGILPIIKGGTNATNTLDAANNLQVYSLGGRTPIPEGADLDTYMTIGNYACSNGQRVQTLLNCPTKSAFIMDVYRNTGYFESVYVGQRVTDYHTGATFFRYWGGSSWTPWKMSNLYMANLWQNADTTAEFPAQTITLDLSSYDMALISCKSYPSSEGLLERVLVGRVNNTLDLGGQFYAGLMRRTANIQSTGVTFSNCYRYTVYNDSSSNVVSNVRCVPVAIYGIRGVR